MIHNLICILQFGFSDPSNQNGYFELNRATVTMNRKIMKLACVKNELLKNVVKHKESPFNHSTYERGSSLSTIMNITKPLSV